MNVLNVHLSLLLCYISSYESTIAILSFQLIHTFFQKLCSYIFQTFGLNGLPHVIEKLDICLCDLTALTSNIVLYSFFRVFFPTIFYYHFFPTP